MANTERFNSYYIALAIFGALIILTGQTQEHPQIFYIIGSSALLITALYFKLVYFIALEIILVAGHSAILLGIGHYTQIALPVLLCMQLLVFYIMQGKENNVFLLIGIAGIALLSVGLSYNDQWIFFSGSLFVAVYAYYSAFKGQLPCYVWAGLNTAFALIALFRLIVA